MELTLHADDTAFDLQDVRSVLNTALSREYSLAQARRNAYQRACEEFERRFEIDSDKFLADFEAGRLGDDAVFFDWYAAKRGLDQWDRRASILAEVAL